MISELLGLYDEVVDPEALTRTTERFRERNIVLPTFAQLADPTTLPAEVDGLLEDVGPDDADARNLWRVHWYNADDRRGRVDVPGYIEIPSELSGVDARIVLALGHRFPMRSTRPDTVPSGRRRATMRAAAWPSPRSWDVAAWRSCPRE